MNAWGDIFCPELMPILLTFEFRIVFIELHKPFMRYGAVDGVQMAYFTICLQFLLWQRRASCFKTFSMCCVTMIWKSHIKSNFGSKGNSHNLVITVSRHWSLQFDLKPKCLNFRLKWMHFKWVLEGNKHDHIMAALCHNITSRMLKNEYTLNLSWRKRHFSTLTCHNNNAALIILKRIL